MHATATVHGASCEVRITRDLVENYAIEVLPPPDPRRRRDPNVRVAPLFIYKLKAENWQAATWAVLQSLQQQGKIEAFECEPVPPKPVKKGPAATAEAEDDPAEG